MATTTTAGSSSNPYVDARNQRLQENKRRFQDLGIANISKSLCEVANSMKKCMQERPKPTPRRTLALDVSELRRSSRARNSVASYREEVDMDDRPLRKSYLARSADEVKLASYEERAYAIKVAEDFQSNLQSNYPSFVKSMVRSHVSSCFWLGLPTTFCKDHLPSGDLKMVLEDDKGSEYDSLYIGSRTGLSGGWRGFALDHKLDDGDALVFELTEPARFKVYIFKVRDNADAQNDSKLNTVEFGRSVNSKRTRKLNENGETNITKSKKTEKSSSENDEVSGRLEREGGAINEAPRKRINKVTFAVISPQEVRPCAESNNGTKMENTTVPKSKNRVARSQNVEASISQIIQPEVHGRPKMRKKCASKKAV